MPLKIAWELMNQTFRSTYQALPFGIRRVVTRNYHQKNFVDLRNSEGEKSLKPFDRHRCIFVHIPKTGGVSISKSLFGNLAGGHMTIERYKIIFTKDEFDQYFKFTFVRNPWDRLVSAFTFLKGGGMDERDERWAKMHLSEFDDFESFVKGWINERNIYSKNHFIPQFEYERLPAVLPAC